MKKILIVILVIVLVIAVALVAGFFYLKSKLGLSGNTDIVEGYYEAFESDAPLEMKYSQTGGSQVGYTEFPSDNTSIGKVRVWYPKELESSDGLWPMVMVAGTGKSDDSGTDPETGFGGVAPLSSLIANYDSISDDIPKVRARAVGAEHEQMLMRSDGYMTAWMLWQLTGDEAAAAAFVGEDAELLHNANWQDVEVDLRKGRFE